MDQTKSFNITKRAVWEAYKKVRANKGSAGVDGVDFEMYEENLENNLYTLWNRMSSGSYMPPAVLSVEIPKSDGGIRTLGIPTIGDRVAQMVAKEYLEPKLEKIFHNDSYGYRPNKSAHQALRMVKERCGKYPFVVDIDIKGFFDNIDHELMMKAVKTHTQEKWVLLYIQRWLKASIQTKEGIVQRDRGTPQGGVISPLLANLFLHYAFDRWMRSNYPMKPFARYADDVVCHCNNEQEAQTLKERVAQRLQECKLELHPTKTKIVYCKDDRRKAEYENVCFDFLGYSFRPRSLRYKDSGKVYMKFYPSISRGAKRRMRQTIKGWSIQRRTYTEIEQLSEVFTPILRGWINYYSLFEKYTIKALLKEHFDGRIKKWAKWKFKKLRRREKKSQKWLSHLIKREPTLFPHWQLQY